MRFFRGGSCGGLPERLGGFGWLGRFVLCRFVTEPLDLGLPFKEIGLLALTLFISAMTLSRGSATVLQGAVHLVLFVVFLFLAIIP